MASGTVDYMPTSGGGAGGTRVSYRFPLDLGSQTQGHFMTITAFPSQSAMSNNKDKSPVSIALFIPGGGQNSSLFWQMDHEYDEVKLARLGTSAIGAIPGVGQAFAAAAGAARVAGQGIINPKVDVLYSNSSLRRFQFDFFMAATSREEQDEMMGIIRTLRKFSAPEVTANAPADVTNFVTQNLPSALADQLKTGFWFVPPAEFEIKFRFIADGQQIENPSLPKIARCVLKNVTVNYTQQGEFSTFQDGSPTTAQLTLDFREMRVISQQDVDEGY
jgi:hypothetical protein